MLHKCANPVCPSVFRSLRHGKLFLLETDPCRRIDSQSLPHEPKRAPSAQGRTLLAVRPLFLSTYPNL